MKRAFASLALLCAAPAFAQGGGLQIETEARPLINTRIVAFNRWDADTMAKEVYASADVAALKQAFAALQAESFGKLDIYSAAFCSRSATEGKAILKYGRLYTFGGLMNGDEAKIFDLAKTDAGWRIAAETDAPYATALSC